MEERKTPRIPIYVLFFLSGACGLIYEIVWTRLLTLVMGSTIYSISTVLTAFMGGLALGSFTAGRLITGRRDELKIYGLLEGTIGIYCLFIPLIIDLFIPFYREIYLSLRDSYFYFSLLRFFISFLILLIPTTLMGATLPILTAYFTRRKERIGGTIGKVYAINTFGAVLGSFGAGFVLLPLFGIKFVIWITALTNISICLIALFYARRPLETSPEQEAASFESLETGEYRPAVLTLLLYAFALSGFASMVYQVIWTRMLTLLIGSSTYAFSLIVTAFILGIGIGSMALSRFIDRKRDLLLYFAVAELIIGTSAMAIAFFFGKLPFTMVNIINTFKTSFALTQFAEFLIILVLLLIPTTMMGVLFPLVSRIYTKNLRMVGKAVGNVYAANTIGAILGSFVGGFLFIPFLGMERGIAVALLLNFIIGFVFLLFSSFRTVPVRLLIALLWIGSCVAFEWWAPPWNKKWITMGPYLYTSAYHKQMEQYGSEMSKKINKYSRMVYFKEGVSATISVRKNMTGELSLQVNGKTDASTGADMTTQELLAHIPVLLHPRPEDVLVIGLASGVTVGSVEKYPVRSVTCVEISPAMVEASNLFRSYNGDAVDDPRLHLIIEDGRNHLLLTEDMYDVVISEPTNPWISGVGNLFTREYFRLIRQKLKEGGTACVWLQAYGLDPADFRMIVRTFLDVFPHTSLWEPVAGTDFILIGQKKPFDLNLDDIEKKFGIPGVSADLERIGIESPIEFLKFFVSGPSRLKKYSRPGEFHTDDNSRLEFSCPKSMYTNTTAKQLEEIHQYRENPLSYLTDGVSEQERKELDSILRGRGMMINAVRSLNKGDMIGAENLLKMALSYAPGEEGARTMLSRQNAKVIVKLTELSNWQELEMISRATLELDEKSFPALDGLSTALVNRNIFDEAALVLERASMLYPDYPAFHGNLGFVYASLGRNDEAIMSYEVATVKDPENSRYAYDLGVLYYNSGRFAEALHNFKNAVLHNPGFVEAYINLGGSYAKLGMIDEAKKAFREALRIDPENQIALRNLSRLD